MIQHIARFVSGYLKFIDFQKFVTKCKPKVCSTISHKENFFGKGLKQSHKLEFKVKFMYIN
jgi:hypothetical protein